MEKAKYNTKWTKIYRYWFPTKLYIWTVTPVPRHSSFKKRTMVPRWRSSPHSCKKDKAYNMKFFLLLKICLIPAIIQTRKRRIVWRQVLRLPSFSHRHQSPRRGLGGMAAQPPPFPNAIRAPGEGGGAWRHPLVSAAAADILGFFYSLMSESVNVFYFVNSWVC